MTEKDERPGGETEPTPKPGKPEKPPGEAPPPRFVWVTQGAQKAPKPKEEEPPPAKKED